MLLIRLFLSFIQVGLFSVGGGYAAIPLIQNQIVNIHGLMTLEEFTDLITIAEMTPGPISINSSTFVGMRLSGPFGVILCLTLAHFYYKYRSFEGVQTVLGALRPAVVALIASAGLSILLLGLFQSGIQGIRFENFHVIEGILFIAGLYLLRKKKAGSISVILGSGVVGTVLYMATGLAV